MALRQRALLTPIEAAALAGHREIVQLLFDLGAAPDAPAWQRAYCGAEEEEVRELLSRYRPPTAVVECAVR
jgi:hypothetical protein